MAILIEGMEMPKKSGQYVLYLDVYGDPPARPPDVHMADCVRYFVFEVPEPHGRLIDADALAEDLEYDVELDSRILDDMDFVGKEREHIQFDKDCKQKCMRYLTEAPTVIPATEAREAE